jgi:hypothetical protein
MGLDMTLYVKTFTKRINDKREQVSIVNIARELKNTSHIKIERIAFIIEEVGIWKDVYHIHNWFVENVQDGIDNCADYYVNENQLKDLLNTCKEVLNDHSKAPVLLPFYDDEGEYDEFYFEEIKETISIIENIFSEFSVNGHFIESVYYCSSF